MQAFIVVILLLGGASYFYLNQAIYGKLPSGARMERIKKSPHYTNGKFDNPEPTPDFAPGVSMWDAAKSFLNKPDNTEPKSTVPSVQTNLKKLDPQLPQVIWFGHSSYLVQTDGIKILVDPVFSGNASPVSLFAKSFKGANNYQAEDFPFIDVLVLTHDHYDHLDYKTILAFKGKFGKIVTSLGVGAHLNHWGIEDAQIIELDWQETAQVADSITITALPARHFSGRKFTRAQSIWSSFALKTPTRKIYLGGDSGFGKHFKEIGDAHGPFDFALLECGQYNAMWPYIHMTPEEVVDAAKALRAEVLMPVHFGKFALAMHAWNEPIKRVTAAAKLHDQKITTPMIGQPVVFDYFYPDSTWWNFE
jgi:L-ascorbate metabolism protein UlaG (beta-lactamase superfamily)